MENAKIKIIASKFYNKWINSLDNVEAFVIITSLKKLSKGNTGALKSLGGGLWEIKIRFRQGFRIYCIHEENTVILLLSGGIKRQQQTDIKRARKIKEFYEQGGNIYE